MAAMTNTETTALPLVAGRWALDTNHSSVGFTVRHLGVSKVRGRFNRFETDVVVGETLADTTVTATIDVASIDTANSDRDAHVLSPEILDVEARPTLAFRSTSIERDGDDWSLLGELTIGEVTKPVTLAVELGGLEPFADGVRHAGFEARTEIRRTDFGIATAIPSAMLGEVIKIELDLQLLEPAAGDAPAA